MRYETNLSTGEVTEHEDAPATPEAAPTAQDLSNIPGVAQVYAVEAEAAALRAQL